MNRSAMWMALALTCLLALPAAGLASAAHGAKKPDVKCVGGADASDAPIVDVSFYCVTGGKVKPFKYGRYLVTTNKTLASEPTPNSTAGYTCKVQGGHSYLCQGGNGSAKAPGNVTSLFGSVEPCHAGGGLKVTVKLLGAPPSVPRKARTFRLKGHC